MYVIYFAVPLVVFKVLPVVQAAQQFSRHLGL